MLVLALLMTGAAIRAAVVDPGFDSDRLINVSAVFGRARSSEADVAAYWQTARERLRGLPGIERTALILFPPYSGGTTLQSTRRNGQRYIIFRNHATPDAFETIGLRLVRGRIYSGEEERTQAPVAVISQTLARDYWPGEDPIGQSLATLHEDMAGIQVVGTSALAPDSGCCAPARANAGLAVFERFSDRSDIYLNRAAVHDDPERYPGGRLDGRINRVLKLLRDVLPQSWDGSVTSVFASVLLNVGHRDARRRRRFC